MHRVDGTETAKAQLRRRLWTLRRSLPDQAQRSAQIWNRVEALEAYRRARCVMAYTSVAGEPDTAEFIARAERSGRRVVVPEEVCLACVCDGRCPDHGADVATGDILATIDVVVLPGLAFSPRGERLGQGGGWYDRLLSRLRTLPGAAPPVVGVCFADQVIDRLPIESHDEPVGTVVTEAGLFDPTIERQT